MYQVLIRFAFVGVTIACVSPIVMGTDAISALEESQDDWPWWRGPNRNGIAPGSQMPPIKWSRSENIQWRVSIPGRGHGSPTVVGDRVYLTVADLQRDIQSVLCFDRNSGEKIWEATVHTGGLKTRGNKKQNKKASLASTSVAFDGERLFANFLNGEAVWTSALDLNGDILWQRKIAGYIVHQGYGSSPAVYMDVVIVSADNKSGGMIMALQRETGEQVWQRQRPKKPNYPSWMPVWRSVFAAAMGNKFGSRGWAAHSAVHPSWLVT